MREHTLSVYSNCRFRITHPAALRHFPFFVKVASTMRPLRFLLPLLLAFTLLFAQQGAAMHALGHILAEQAQQDKQTPHSPVCEQCATYAQLGGALGSSTHSFSLDAALTEAVRCYTTAFRSTHTLTTVARGPPSSLQKIA